MFLQTFLQTEAWSSSGRQTISSTSWILASTTKWTWSMIQLSSEVQAISSISCILAPITCWTTVSTHPWRSWWLGCSPTSTRWSVSSITPSLTSRGSCSARAFYPQDIRISFNTYTTILSHLVAISSTNILQLTGWTITWSLTRHNICFTGTSGRSQS